MYSFAMHATTLTILLQYSTLTGNTVRYVYYLFSCLYKVLSIHKLVY